MSVPLTITTRRGNHSVANDPNVGSNASRRTPMVPKLSGGCLCGVVRYVLTQRVRFNPYACHCTDCQRRTGGAFGVQLTARREDVEFTGDLAQGKHVQPSGAVAQIFA